MTTLIKNSANMFDYIVKCEDKINSISDISLAIEEFGLGVPQAVRSLDIGFGYVPILGDTSYSTDTIEFSPGQGRYNGVLTTPALNTQSLTPSDNLGSMPLQNVYAFGSVYITPPVMDSAPILQTTLAVGVGQSSIAPPLCMIRDVDSDIIQQWLFNDITPPGLPPGGHSLELVRFVLDIDTYVASENPNNVINIYIRDMRRIRGFGGFAEEVMATTLVPVLINYANNTNKNVNSSQALILKAVQTWVGLSDWAPDFVTFWNSNGNLPLRLKEYIQAELGLPLL